MCNLGRKIASSFMIRTCLQLRSAVLLLSLLGLLDAITSVSLCLACLKSVTNFSFLTARVSNSYVVHLSNLIFYPLIKSTLSILIVVS